MSLHRRKANYPTKYVKIERAKTFKSSSILTGTAVMALRAFKKMIDGPIFKTIRAKTIGKVVL